MMNYPAKLIKKALQLLCTKNFILFILICIFAYSVAGAMFDIMRERTLGSVFRHFLSTTPYLFLIILISLYDIKKFSFSSLVPNDPSDFSPKLFVRRYLMIAFLAVLVGWLFFQYAIGYSSLYILIFLYVIAGYLLSLYALVRYKLLYGLIIFLMVQPFISFLSTYLFARSFHTDFFKYVDPTPSIIVFLLFFSVFIIKRFIFEKVNIKTALNKPIFVLFAILLISTILSSNFSTSLKDLLLQFIYPYMFFLLVINSVDNETDFKLLLYSFMVYIFINIFIAFYFGLKIEGDVYSKSMYEMSGNNIYYIWLLPRGIKSMALILYAISIPVILSYEKPKAKIFAMVNIFISFFIIVFTYSRQSLLALMVSTTFFVRHKKAIYILIITIVLLYIYWPQVKKYLAIRFANVHSIHDFSLERLSKDRTQAWLAAIKMIKDKPLFGFGLNTWPENSIPYGAVNYLTKDPMGNPFYFTMFDPHNHYLSLGVSAGIGCIATWLWLLFSFFKKIFFVYKKTSNEFYKYLSLGLISALIGLCIYYPYSITSVFVQPLFSFWMFLGIGVVLYRLFKEGKSTN